MTKKPLKKKEVPGYSGKKSRASSWYRCPEEFPVELKWTNVEVEEADDEPLPF